jgi:cytochrome c2
MAYVRSKTAVPAIAAAIAGVAAAGIAADMINDRDDRWEHAAATTGGDPERGENMFVRYGCGSCHSLSNVRNATGKVGPPLDGIAQRAVIAGKLSNTPENLQRWIREPHAVTPGTAMPDLHVGESDARDIVAFLYTRSS